MSVMYSWHLNPIKFVQIKHLQMQMHSYSVKTPQSHLNLIENWYQSLIWLSKADISIARQNFVSKSFYESIYDILIKLSHFEEIDQSVLDLEDETTQPFPPSIYQPLRSGQRWISYLR